MRIVTFMAVLFLLGGGFAGCESDDWNNPIAFTEFSFVGYSDLEFLNYEGSGNVVFVNSNEELKKLSASTEYPSIDFSNYTLALISGTTTSGITTKTLTNVQRLSANKYKFDVKITLNAACVMQRWKIAVLISKASNNCKGEVNVTTIP